MDIREIRTVYGLSQQKAAEITGVPIRTYRRYESDEHYGDSIKRQMIAELLKDRCEITEEKGILDFKTIQSKLTNLFDTEYKGKIDFCYLFGSYACGMANDESDVDLYVSSSLVGFGFTGLIERIRQVLHKKIDLIRSSELNNNIELVNEILKKGIKIYG